MELLSRDAILSANDIITEEVEVPEWGGRVRVRALTGTDRDTFEASMVKTKKLPKGQTEVVQDYANMRAKLCALAIVDAEGRPLFTHADVATLGAKSAAALDRVYEVAARLAKLTKADEDELMGNSDSADSAVS